MRQARVSTFAFLMLLAAGCQAKAESTPDAGSPELEVTVDAELEKDSSPECNLDVDALVPRRSRVRETIAASGQSSTRPSFHRSFGALRAGDVIAVHVGSTGGASCKAKCNAVLANNRIVAASSPPDMTITYNAAMTGVAPVTCMLHVGPVPKS